MAMAAGLRAPSTPNLLSPPPPPAHTRKRSQISSSLGFPGRGGSLLHQNLAFKTLTNSHPRRLFTRNEHPRLSSSPPSAGEPGQSDAVLLGSVQNLIQGRNREGIEGRAGEQGRGSEIGDYGPQRLSGSGSCARVYESVMDFVYLVSDIIAFLIQLSIIVSVWSLKIVLRSPFWCLGAIFRSIGRVFGYIKTIFLG